jgi:hypothetical protein
MWNTLFMTATYGVLDIFSVQFLVNEFLLFVTACTENKIHARSMMILEMVAALPWLTSEWG